MTMPDSSGNRPKRMSTGVKLVLVGVGAAALLYSCSPVVGGIPHFWWFGNPFYRGGGWFGSPSGVGTTTTTTTGSSNSGASTSPGTTTSQRGGFGGSAGEHGGGSSS